MPSYGYMRSADFAATLAWDRNVQVWIDQITRAEIDRLNRGVELLALKYSALIETWLKQNAPWEDKTGNARQGLRAEVQKLVQDVTSIVLDHGVDYGVWLELKYQGRYAIIQPALDYWTPKVFDDVARLVEGK